LRRVNARYVIATNTKVDLKGVDDKTLEKISEPNYFTKEKKSEKAKTEEAFFKQGEKPEVGLCSFIPSYYVLTCRIEEETHKRPSVRPEGR
jgi:Ribosomal protein L6e